MRNMSDEPTYLPNTAPDDQDFVTPIVVRKGGRPGLVSGLQMAGAVIFMGIAALFPFAEVAATWASRQSLRMAVTGPGPACPQVAKLSIAALGAKPPKPFDYKGSHFAYQIGDVTCDAAPLHRCATETIPASHYAARAATELTTNGRTTIFEPGVGHSATVAVLPQGPTCTIGGEYRVTPKL
ncbi:MAG: hypothetical protein JSR98_01070 [Proteobacteria bacterium]|nr:hypothetical protein [Pseudomonadota bacterium]